MVLAARPARRARQLGRQVPWVLSSHLGVCDWGLSGVRGDGAYLGWLGVVLPLACTFPSHYLDACPPGLPCGAVQTDWKGESKGDSEGGLLRPQLFCITTQRATGTIHPCLNMPAHAWHIPPARLCFYTLVHTGAYRYVLGCCPWLLLLLAGRRPCHPHVDILTLRLDVPT